MNKVYIVLGCSGYDEDYIEWIVCTYPDEESANQHCKLAQEEYDKQYLSRKADIKTPYDENHIPLQEVNVKYKVEEHRFARHVDEFLDLIQE